METMSVASAMWTELDPVENVALQCSWPAIGVSE